MTPAQFIANLRATKDPNWSDVQHLLELVWSGEVGAVDTEAALDRVRAGIRSRLDDIAARNALGNISHAGHMYEIADARHAARREAGE